MRDDPAPTGWHIDRRIPIAQIVSLLSAIAIGAWYMSALAGRVDHLETGQSTNNARIVALEAGGSDFRVQLARMTALLQSIDQRLARQEERWDRRSDADGPPPL